MGYDIHKIDKRILKIEMLRIFMENFEFLAFKPPYPPPM
jgi:hypothetical protein